MDRLLDVLSIACIVMIFIVLRSVRRERIRVEHSVAWLVAAAALLILSRSHALMDELARFLGLADSALALIFAILIVFLGMFYRHSRVVSELKDMNITLTQRVAILEFRIQSNNETSVQTGQKTTTQDTGDSSGR